MFSRIDAAIARIEAALAKPRPEDTGGVIGADADLAARHAALRAAVADSLRSLDGLIAEQSA